MELSRQTLQGKRELTALRAPVNKKRNFCAAAAAAAAAALS